MQGVLAEARHRGLREVWLEVLVQNEPAIRLYEKLGFDTVRGLEVWALEPLVLKQHKVGTVGSEQAQARIRRERTWREPWQRADESVANLEGVEGLESERGTVLFRQDGRADLAAPGRRPGRNRGSRAARGAAERRRTHCSG